jgi:hypothetical protein
MTLTALQRKVELLEKAVLQLRFQIEQTRHTGGAGAGASAPFGVAEFGRRIGRSAGWVRREILHHRIRAYGRPALIPRSELARFL